MYNESLIEQRVRLRTSEPGQRLKELFLIKQRHQNEKVQQILDRTESVRNKSIATINRANQVASRSKNILNSSQQISMKMDQLRNYLKTDVSEENKPPTMDF